MSSSASSTATSSSTGENWKLVRVKWPSDEEFAKMREEGKTTFSKTFKVPTAENIQRKKDRLAEIDARHQQALADLKRSEEETNRVTQKAVFDLRDSMRKLGESKKQMEDAFAEAEAIDKKAIAELETVCESSASLANYFGFDASKDPAAFAESSLAKIISLDIDVPDSDYPHIFAKKVLKLVSTEKSSEPIGHLTGLAWALLRIRDKENNEEE